MMKNFFEEIARFQRCWLRFFLEDFFYELDCFIALQ